MNWILNHHDQEKPPVYRNGDISKPVLCLVKNTQHIANMVVCEYFHNEGKFYVCASESIFEVEELFTDWDAEKEELAYISHWMELPEPPNNI